MAAAQPIGAGLVAPGNVTTANVQPIGAGLETTGDVNAKDHEGKTALMRASILNNKNEVKRLL